MPSGCRVELIRIAVSGVYDMAFGYEPNPNESRQLGLVQCGRFLEGCLIMTQIELARRGMISAEMAVCVARRENLEPELVRSEVARGRMVIPANTVHLKLGLSRWASASRPGARSTPTSATRRSPRDIENELAKLHDGRPPRLRHGHGPLDRRQHRRASARRSSPPVAGARSAPCRSTRRSSRSRRSRT